MTILDTIKKELKEWYIAIFKAKRPSDIHREIFKEFEKEYIGMTEKRFIVVDDGFFKYIEDTTLIEDKHEGHINDAYELCRELNRLYEENQQLKDEVYNELDDSLTVLQDLYKNSNLKDGKKLNGLYNHLKSLRDKMVD